MAQLNNMETGGNRKTKGVKGRKTLPTKVDMTPMVDLAFLLITFFIFTATMNEQVTMNLVMPKDGPKTPVKETGALTLILGKNDTVYYYQGELTNATDIQTTTTGNIRKIIIAKKEAVEARYIPDPLCEQAKANHHQDIKDCRQEDFFVLIKPGTTSAYKTVVNVLDEMTINRVLRYSLASLNPEELKRLQL
jgi:biopolymer transport protein ExbD